MNQYDICCIGHITHDKVVTPRDTKHCPGGTSYYFSHAISRLNHIDYALVTALAADDIAAVDELRSMGMNITVLPSEHSVYFENIYEENQDKRRQRVLAKAAPFRMDDVKSINAKVFHLGALLADDFEPGTIKLLSGKGLVSIDAQGYLREVRDTAVFEVDWKDKEESLQYVHFLKVNETEMKALTGSTDVVKAATIINGWGVCETLITLGSMGALLYDGKNFYRIPAYKPREVVDATGCGDTYMAGYLHQRARGLGMSEAGHFAAALATLKIERSGPACAGYDEVMACMKSSEKLMPEIF